MTNESIYAQPYNGDYNGFSFETLEEYDRKSESLRKRGCDEWELSYLDGDNVELFNAAEVCQGNITDWLELLDTVEDYQRPALFYLLDTCGESMSDALQHLDDVMVFEGDAVAYAEELIDDTGALEGLPESLRYYFDYEGLARDMRLNGEATEVSYAGTTYTVSGY